MKNINQLIELYNEVFRERKNETNNDIIELEIIRQNIINEYGIYVNILHARKIDRYDEDETNRNGWSYCILDMATHNDFSENMTVYLTYNEALLNGLIDALACISLGWNKREIEDERLEFKPFKESEELKTKIESINFYLEECMIENNIEEYSLLSIKPLENEKYELWYRIKIPFKSNFIEVLTLSKNMINDLDGYTFDNGHCVLDKIEGNTSDGYLLYLKI